MSRRRPPQSCSAPPSRSANRRTRTQRQKIPAYQPRVHAKPYAPDAFRSCKLVLSRSTCEIKHQPSPFLPVVIDMARGLVFIKSDARLFVFHRLEECLSLAFAHLTFLLRFGLGDLGGFLRRRFL